FELRHQPTTAGVKNYIIEVEAPEEIKKTIKPKNLRALRQVTVKEIQPLKVLYVENTPRYEYRYIKALLEREIDDVKGKKTIDLKVILTESPRLFLQDSTALTLEMRGDQPVPLTREQLLEYNVILLGDVTPSDLARFLSLKDLHYFVSREKGGGLLMIAGENYAPHDYQTDP